MNDQQHLLLGRVRADKTTGEPVFLRLPLTSTTTCAHVGHPDSLSENSTYPRTLKIPHILRALHCAADLRMSGILGHEWKELSKPIIDASGKYGLSALRLEAEAWHVKNLNLSVDNAVDELAKVKVEVEDLQADLRESKARETEATAIDFYKSEMEKIKKEKDS